MAGCLLLGNISAQDDVSGEVGMQTDAPKVNHLEDYEPDIVHIPDLKENYGIEFDRNHMLGPVSTAFVME